MSKLTQKEIKEITTEIKDIVFESLDDFGYEITCESEGYDHYFISDLLEEKIYLKLSEYM